MINIRVNVENRQVFLDKTFIGNELENLQETLNFKLENGEINGQGRLEYINKNHKNYVMLDHTEEGYSMPVKNIITKSGNVNMQLVITENGEYIQTQDDKYKAHKQYYSEAEEIYTLLIEDEDYQVGDNIEGTIYEYTNIPVFKSNVFYLYCGESINAVEEAPEGYELWIERANAKLNEVDTALRQAENLNIESERVIDGVEITITNKEGQTTTVKVTDGEKGEEGEAGKQGEKGEDAKINGYNTITIQGGTNIVFEQEDDTFVINNTYDDSTIIQNIDTLEQAISEHDREIQNIANDIEELQGDVSDLGTGIDNLDVTKQNKTDNSLTTINKEVVGAINEVNSIAKGANQAISYDNYAEMILVFNGFPKDLLNEGQNVMIVTLDVPDLWVSGIEQTSSAYTYVDDATVISDLQENGYIKVGYYRLSQLETQKVDLTEYEQKTNKTTIISSSSTDTQYPSAKAVYDLIGPVNNMLDTLNGEVL